MIAQEEIFLLSATNSFISVILREKKRLRETENHLNYHFYSTLLKRRLSPHRALINLVLASRDESVSWKKK